MADLTGHSPPASGVILQVSISSGGIPKLPILSGFITPTGIQGDAWSHPEIHGGLRQAVLIVTSEAIEELQAAGYPLYFGALGENLTTRGLDRRQLRLGHRLRAGAALLEVTKVRGPCTALHIYGPSLPQAIYDPAVKAGDCASPRWGLSGFYACVLEPGPVFPGDIIAVVP